MAEEDAAELEDRKYREEQRKEWDRETRAAEKRNRDEVFSDAMTFRMNPAWDLQCCGLPTDPEDMEDAWCRRWSLAGERVGWAEAAGAFRDDEGQLHLIAMVTSPIWKELGRMGWGRDDFDTPPFVSGSVWHCSAVETDALLGFGLMDRETLDSYLEERTADKPLSEGDRGIMDVVAGLSQGERDQLRQELEGILADGKKRYRRSPTK
ncbi:MAG: hypothetical protein IJS32_02585 [Kiritimatiellae bacterium]|nr:hypothetical protein [Kiritimatiellia bacterium]